MASALPGPFAALRSGLEASAGGPLPEFERFLAATRQLRLRRGEELFPAGVRHPYFYQVTHGVVRMSADNSRGQTFNLALAEEGELVASFSAILPPHVVSVIRGLNGMDEALSTDLVTTTRFAVHAVTDAYLWRFDSGLTAELSERHLAWSRLVLNNVWVYALLKESRQHELMMMTVEQRCIKLLRSRPTLAARVPKRELASYLGMTPESFSRMRLRLRQRGLDIEPPAMRRPRLRPEFERGFWSRTVPD